MTEQQAEAQQAEAQQAEQGEAPLPTVEQGKAGVNLHDPRAATLGGELPCGHIDAGGQVHFSYLVQEMSGTEEDILAGKGPVIARLNRMIGNCLVQLGSLTGRGALRAVAHTLASMDRSVLLIAVRRASLGDLYDMRVLCPKCSKETPFAVDLSELAITPMPDRSVRVFEEPLPSGRTAVWRVMGVEDEEWAGRRRKGSDDDLATLSLAARVTHVDGRPLDRERGWAETLRALKALPLRDRERLRIAFDEREGGIDDKVEFACAACEHEWTASLDVSQPGFFFPSAASGR
jgi:hypothetical protein